MCHRGPARPLLVLLLPILLALSATYTTTAHAYRLTPAMAATKPITVVTGANKGIG